MTHKRKFIFMYENKESRKSQPLELRYRLFFFFVPIIMVTSFTGANFKALGYERKEKDKWTYIGAGFLFYFILLIVVVRILN